MTCFIIIIEHFSVFNLKTYFPKWMIINVTSWEVELGGKMTLMCGEAEGTSKFDAKIQCYTMNLVDRSPMCNAR